jgi:alkanesulfonate monooxygenase SsuD/methylene tetrahydromethanopterin reductase-like flavin-dependent oxidoreductase (luciferase family)
VAARRAIFVAPFGELADARRLARLAEAAEAAGWNGFFLWDHLVYTETRKLADPWIAMTAIACATERLRFGPLVTPTPRRRIQKLARETVTLDRLSGGRLVLGVGIGGDRHGEFAPFGDEAEPRERARLLDEGLERLVELWDGEFEPVPEQQPRIPIWVAARWPARRPVRRAARWDGVFPIDLSGPEALAELVAAIEPLREDATRPYDYIVTNPAGTDPGPWEEAGATWCLSGFGAAPTEAEVREAIDAGPLAAG